MNKYCSYTKHYTLITYLTRVTFKRKKSRTHQNLYDVVFNSHVSVLYTFLQIAIFNNSLKLFRFPTPILI